MENQTKQSTSQGLGTAPVFLASISTILGAIMFLRFGYAVANVGIAGTLFIILLGHLVTIPTALAIAEIATNRKVEGGGEYFIISRSFGTTIGSTIGLALFLSQAISVAFYMIAFAEAFRPISAAIESLLGIPFDPRMISLPCTILLIVLILLRGVNMGVAALYVVVGVLGVALAMFFLGSTPEGVTVGEVTIFSEIPNAAPFMVVFAIIFPAFTGMTAGVGLSGDLANPRRSLPIGIFSATIVGLLVYALQVIKLALSAPPELLASDQLVMSKIAIWGPMIPIGLGAATLSSALGSILVAPRTIQAMARDRVVGSNVLNNFLGAGVGNSNEPRNATLVTGVIALVIVALGNVDFVARIISMFFMVTYGSLCAISFLEHFASRPGYRPSFRSRWYISLVGAVMCVFLMFQMDPLYALASIVVMTGIYRLMLRSRAGQADDLAAIFRGVFGQATRHMQIKLQRTNPVRLGSDWRPSVIMVDGRTFERAVPIQFLEQLCHRFGFGTYVHYIQGHLNGKTHEESRTTLAKLLKSTEHKQGDIFIDTVVSPSMRSALAQALQLPGVSGMENNTIMFAMSVHDEVTSLGDLQGDCLMAASAGMNVLLLRHGDHFFGNRRTIHVWLTWHDYRNANLMILLAYILLDHPDWHEAEISINAAFSHEQAHEETVKLRELISAGRIPITERRIRIFPTDDRVNFDKLVETHSADADLVIFGFTPDRLEKKGIDLFKRHPALRDVLWVSAQERILIE